MSVSGDDKAVKEEESKPEEKGNEASSPAPPTEGRKPESKEEKSEEKLDPSRSEKNPAIPVENGDVKTGTGTTADTPESNTAVSTGGKAVGFKERFKQFSKFGDPKSDGKMITLSQSDKWMKQAKVIDKKISTTDTGIYFKKFKMQKIQLSDYEKFLEDLAKSKKVELDEIKKKMIECGAPGLSGPSGAVVKASPSAVERLTDVSKYTGSHKQRFDESGKGKGISGRRDTTDKSGYVQGYQNKDSYNKTH